MIVCVVLVQQVAEVFAAMFRAAHHPALFAQQRSCSQLANDKMKYFPTLLLDALIVHTLVYLMQPTNMIQLIG